YPALYEKLEEVRVSPERPGTAGPTRVRPAAQALSLAAPRRRPFSQVGVQFLRGVRLLIRDRALLALLVCQPVVIGLLINLSQMQPSGLQATFLFSVITAIWLGLNNTAREVVRERPIYTRERLLGVTLLTYLAAKVLLFSLVGAVQLLLLVLVVRYV